MPMNQYEIDHLATVRAKAPESMVLLASDGAFPLTGPGEIALFGPGARHTLKGGTGSGDVNSRHVVSIEEGLTNAGFTITTTAWLDSLDGATERGEDLAVDLEAKGEAAVYVLTRNSGEGGDRSPDAGDVALTEAEIRDILDLDKRFEKFLLVLNVAGVVDLAPVKDVGSILLLSQLGAAIGDSFADVLLGTAYPSGKLSTTWAAWGDYPTIGDFGGQDDTHYREGVYVGYRYFDSAGVTPIRPFGFGLGYTTFRLGQPAVSLEDSRVTVSVEAANTGGRAGKEVVQVYVSVPAGGLDQPYQALAGFQKSGEIAPGAAQQVSVTFDLADLASYDAARAATVLEAGDYVVRVGTSSRDTTAAAVISLRESAVVRQLHDVLGDSGFTDWKPPAPVPVDVPAGLPRLEVGAGALRREDSGAAVDLGEAMAYAAGLSDDQLSYLVVGDYREGGEAQPVVGAAAQTLAGAAGQSTTRVEGLRSLIMVDGPAGLRITPEVGYDADGAFALGQETPSGFNEPGGYHAAGVESRMAASGRQRVPDRVVEQYATAIPVGTAVAQSWNPEVAEAFGDLVGAEMDRFGAHLWLAPAFNLHRSILCGRNFEYLSEDPLLAGRIAAALTRGVQGHPGRGATIKHFALNNQETNRFNSSSRVSKRAARDLYLRSFEIVVREASPHALMTSYNLVNGVHASESSELVETILREEWGFQGLVMSDWVISADARHDMTYPPATAAASVKAGNELFMPGSDADRQDVLASLRGEEGRVPLSHDELVKQAARVVRAVWALAGR